MLKLFVCFYGNEFHKELWLEALAHYEGPSFETAVFLGDSSEVSDFLNAHEVVAPDTWLKSLQEFRPQEKSLYAFARLASSFEFVDVIRYANRVMDRRDYSGTLRNVDREIFCRSLIIFYLEKLLDREVSGVLFDVLPHTPDAMIVYKVAQHLGIPTLTFEGCGVAPVKFPVTSIATADRFLAQKSQTNFGRGRREDVHDVIISRVWQRRQILGDSRKSEDYIQRQRQRSRPRPFYSLERLRKVSLRFGSQSLTAMTTLPGLENIPSRARALIAWMLERAFRAQLSRAINRLPERGYGEQSQFVGVESSPITRRLGLFALHFEPESTAFPEGLPVWHQLDAVAESLRILKKDSLLFVKEHPSQTLKVMQGYMGRSPLFFSLLRNVERVELVSGETSGKELLESVDIVFTLTGTIAFEALDRGREVIHFGSPWWEGCPGTTKAAFGELQSASFPREDYVAPEPSVIWQFLLQQIQELGIYYPETRETCDFLSEAARELSRTLCIWVKMLETEDSL